MSTKYRALILALVAVGVIGFSGFRPGQTIYLDATSLNLLKLGNRYYEIGFAKSNGGIRYILDKATGQEVSAGNLNGCLWSFVAANSAPIEGANACSYSPNGASTFRYAWSASQSRLTFEYLPESAAAGGITAAVTINASEDNWFDLQIQVLNGGSRRTGEINFPANLAFARDQIREALLPILPGVILEPGFFSRGEDYTTLYPGYPGVFSDYVDVVSSAGQFAMYSIAGKDQVIPTSLGFNFSRCSGGKVCAIHAYKATLPANSSWGPARLRIWISKGRNDVLSHFRQDIGIDQYSSLKTKTGALYQQLIQSPLYKADAMQLAQPFSAYPDLLKEVPYPGLLHPVAYEAEGFDRNYPDLLPPKAEWGSTEEMAEMISAAHALGYLVMPYTNPTWWDEKSPTLTSLPESLKLQDLTVTDGMGRYITECYGCPANPHYGVVVSPFVPYVQDRIAKLIRQEMQDLGSDLVFEDQIGARPPLTDNNPDSPTPESYAQGWLDHTREYSSIHLMTELGFDRLAATETGLNGSLLLPERAGLTDTWWGRGNWHYYPFATQVARDKVLFYQHDLAPETFTFNKSTLVWNMSMGYMLSYDFTASTYGGGFEGRYLPVVGVFQKYVLARYASERVTDFRYLQESVTKTSFENYTVTTNWSKDAPYDAGAYILRPAGVMVQKIDGSFTAGIFARYNHVDLSPRDHYLIEERLSREIIVRQPLGADTDLTLTLLPGWKAGAPLQVAAYTKDGRLIDRVPATVSGQSLTFRYSQKISNQQVAYYDISLK